FAARPAGSAVVTVASEEQPADVLGKTLTVQVVDAPPGGRVPEHHAGASATLPGGTEGSQTLRWRKQDSNPRSPQLRQPISPRHHCFKSRGNGSARGSGREVQQKRLRRMVAGPACSIENGAAQGNLDARGARWCRPATGSAWIGSLPYNGL